MEGVTGSIPVSSTKSSEHLMITIEKALCHMAWSNQKIFSELASLPEEIFSLCAADGEWPIGKILNHFFAAAEWYRFLLTEKPWTEIPKITNSATMKQLQPYLAELDHALVNESLKSDAEISFTDDDGSKKMTTRSLVLSQAVTHTAEHKGQLATILRVHGFHLDLDKFDLWSFEALT